VIPTDEKDNNAESNEHRITEIKLEKDIVDFINEELVEKVTKLEYAKKILEAKISKESKSTRELLQEKEILNELNNVLSENQSEFEKIKQNYEKKESKNLHTINELRQDKAILDSLNQSMDDTMSKLNETNIELENKVSQFSKNSHELEQEKAILDEIVESQSDKTHAINKKLYLTVAIAGVVLAGVIVPYSLYTITLLGQEYQIEDLGEIKSGYIVQNLRGVTIDTWLSWRITEGDLIYINILNGEEYPEKAELIKDTILSNEKIKVDKKLLNPESEGTSTFYLGWAGALEKASQFPTELYIPKNIEIITETNGAGDIIIRLEDKSHGDGISGLTESIADQNQLLKSTITIYDVEDISDNQLQTVSRHELGHAFGLSHSTDPDDLMHPTIKTGFPYVSECDVRALALLYDGSKQSEVVCIKLGD